MEAIPRVTAVLFEDGSAEGDTAALDRQTAERAVWLRIRQYWLDRFHEACAQGVPENEQLKRFAAIVREPAPQPPAELAANSRFAGEKRWLEQQVGNAMQQAQTYNIDAGSILRGLGAELLRRVSVAKQAADLFPARKT